MSELRLNTDGHIIKFGADNDVSLTHVADTGLTTNGTFQATTITATTAVVPDASDGAALGTTALEWSDLFLADGAVINFGDDQDVSLTHVADVGLNLKHTATADDKPIILTLQTGETDMAANDVIGKIAFQAPDEGTGTDAILVSAAIQAVAEGDHSSSSNATRLEFMTGSSEAATQKLQITSDGRGLSQFTAKAWVNFNSSDTIAIVDSHNVSSMTDVSSGLFTINFTNNMANANYVSVLTMEEGENTALFGGRVDLDTPPTTSAFRTWWNYAYSSGQGYSDTFKKYAIVFGD